MDAGGAVAAALHAEHEQEVKDSKEQAKQVADVLDFMKNDAKAEVFKMLDKNHDGVISTAEMMGGKQLTPQEIETIQRIPGALHRVNEDGEGQVMTGAHVMKVLHDRVNERRAQMFHYLRLCSFILYTVLYIIILFMQRDTTESFEIEEALKGTIFSERTNTLEQSSGEITVNMDGIDHIYSWLESHFVDQVFTEPVCGDGQCDEPREFPQWGTYGCSSDCGWYPQSSMSQISVKVSAEFASETEMNTAWWNMCSPTHDICLFESNKQFTSMNDTQTTTIWIPDGDWVVKLFASDGSISGKVYNSTKVIEESTVVTNTTSNSTTNSTTTTEIIVVEKVVETTIVEWEQCQLEVNEADHARRVFVTDSCRAATGVEPRFCGPTENCMYCASEEICVEQQECEYDHLNGCLHATCGPHAQCSYCRKKNGCESAEGCVWDTILGTCQRDETLCDSSTCSGDYCFPDACLRAGCNMNPATFECAPPCEEMNCSQCYGPKEECDALNTCYFEDGKCKHDCHIDSCDTDAACQSKKQCEDVGCSWDVDSKTCELPADSGPGSGPGSGPPDGGSGCSGTNCAECSADDCGLHSSTCDVFGPSCGPKCNPDTCDTPGCNSLENCEFVGCEWFSGTCEVPARRKLIGCSPDAPCSQCNIDIGCSLLDRCQWEYGECKDAAEYEATECSIASESRCAESYQLGNNRCENQCNIPACSYDGGDCEDTAMWLKYQCAPQCYCNLLGDGVCNPECDKESCGSDMGDCCNRLYRGEHSVRFSLWGHSTPETIQRLTPDPSIPRARYFSGSNRILGGILLTLKRRKHGNCGRFSHLYNGCFEDGEETAPYGADPVFLKSSDLYNPSLSKASFYNMSDHSEVSPLGTPYGFRYVEIEGFEEVAGYPMFFDINLSEERANKFFLYAKQGFYLDSRTDSLNVQVVTFNGHHNLFASIKTVFSFELGGRISMNYDVQTLKVDLEDELRARLEYLFFALTLINMIFEVFEAILSKYFTGRWFGHFRSFWNYVEFVSISLFIFLMKLWNDYVTLATSYDPQLRYIVYKSLDLEARFLDINKEALGEMLTMFGETQQMADSIASYLSYTGLALITLILRLLKVLDFQKRMGVVTRTVESAINDLCHFAVLFMLIFSLYATMGHLIFGASVIGFSTMWKSMNTCFAILLGEIGVTEELFNLPNATPAILYYYTYIFVVFFVLLNVLLAILVEAYVEVKAAAEGSASLPREFLDVCNSTLRNLPGWRLPKSQYFTDKEMQEVITAFLYEKDMINNKTKLGRRTANIEGFKVTFEDLKHSIMVQLHDLKKEKVDPEVREVLKRGNTKFEVVLEKFDDDAEIEKVAEKIAANFLHRYGEGRDVVKNSYKVGPEEKLT